MKWTKEAVVALVLLVGMGLLLRSMSPGEAMPLRRHLAQFPLQAGPWSGTELGLAAQILQVLQVDDYLLRQYGQEHGLPISLYVGYYASQRQGVTYHSPKNCLPGAGWTFVSAATTPLDIAKHPGQTVRINRVLIQKGLAKQLVLYWYQDRGRILTSEYWAKIYMILDAMRTNRTDGALVRIMVPFTGDNEAAAFQQGKAFVETIFPLLQTYLPG